MHELADMIVNFIMDYDLYEFKDSYDDREEAINETLNLLDSNPGAVVATILEYRFNYTEDEDNDGVIQADEILALLTDVYGEDSIKELRSWNRNYDLSCM